MISGIGISKVIGILIDLQSHILLLSLRSEFLYSQCEQHDKRTIPSLDFSFSPAHQHKVGIPSMLFDDSGLGCAEYSLNW